MTLLIRKQFSLGSSPLSSPLELEAIPKSGISHPVVRLAEECLEGHRDGLYEVYCGFGLLRTLASSPDHVETFNETGTAKVVSIVTGKNQFVPALLRYRASVLLLDLLSYASVAETVASLSTGGKADGADGTLVSRERSRSRSRNKNKKADNKRRSEESSHKSVKPEKSDKALQSKPV